MSVEQRMPTWLVGPAGIVSLFVGLVSIVLGYIFTVIGVTLLFDLNGIQGIDQTEAITVIVTGVVLVGVAYLGYRGFMRFAT